MYGIVRAVSNDSICTSILCNQLGNQEGISEEGIFFTPFHLSALQSAIYPPIGGKLYFSKKISTEMKDRKLTIVSKKGHSEIMLSKFCILSGIRCKNKVMRIVETRQK